MASSNCSIIRAGSEQLDQLAALLAAYRAFYSQSLEVEECRTFLSQRLAGRQSVIFLATCDQAPAGFTQLYPSFSTVRLARIWILNDLFVDPEFRRRGVADALLEAAESFAREQGAAGLTLETDVTNSPAQALYERRGWVRETGRYHYSKATE